jgi:hypothetical protein
MGLRKTLFAFHSFLFHSFLSTQMTQIKQIYADIYFSGISVCN